MDTFTAMKTRKSTRSYTGALSEEDLKAVLMAGEAAPIGRGLYDDMHMTVIRDKDLLNEIDRNAAAFFHDPSRTPLYGAPCLILIDTALGEPAMNNVPYSDCAVMAENMTLMATDIGLGSCLIWGGIAALNTNPELVAKLGLPEGHTPCCGVVIGETTDELVERDIPEDRIAVSYIG